MSGPLIRLGDKTSHGSVVIEAWPHSDVAGVDIARMGDTTVCPIHVHGCAPIVSGSGGNAPGDASCGAWVHVAEGLAGPNWASEFIPRIGTEVLVAFVEGDIDRPLVVGQLHNEYALDYARFKFQ